MTSRAASDSGRRQRRILAVGLVLLLIAAVYRFWPELQEVLDRGDVEQMTESIVSLRNRLAEKKVLEQQQVDLLRELDLFESGLLKGATNALSAVTMQNLLYDLARKNGIEIQTMRVLKPEKVDNEDLAMYTLITVQAAMGLDVGQLRMLLFGLAASSDVLIVETLLLKRETRSPTGKITATLTLKGVMLEP